MNNRKGPGTLLGLLLLLPSVEAAQTPPPQVDTSTAPLILRLPAAPAQAPVRNDSVVMVQDFDQPPELVKMPTVRAPADVNGVGGSVRVLFVVDSTGGVEPGSIQILSTTNTAFTAPVVDALRQSRWRPARLRHQRVRAFVTTSIAVQTQ